MDRNREGFIDVQRDTFLYVLLEALGLDFEPIVADGEFEQHVVSGMIGGRTTRQTRLNLCGGYQAVANNGTAGIERRPTNASSDLLSGDSPAQKNDSERKEPDLETDHRLVVFPWRIADSHCTQKWERDRPLQARVPHESALIIGIRILRAIIEK